MTFASIGTTLAYIGLILAKLDNMKLISKHVLNSTHKSCKLQNNCFKCVELGNCHKYLLPHLPNAISPLTSIRSQGQFCNQEWQAMESHRRHCAA